jgi:transcriptional regulator with XRE-family HTH domain
MSDSDPDLDPEKAKRPPLAISGRDPAAIGRRLRLTRQVFGLKQTEFSKRANVDNTTYNQFENGVHKPSMESAMALCDAYHLTLGWIYRGDLRGLRSETAAAIVALSQGNVPNR